VRHHIVLEKVAEGVGPAGCSARRGDHAPYAKGNFQFERVIVGWRAQRVLDLRRKT
jgi:hypothetical protein